MVVLARKTVQRGIAQHIVHPAHVPLEVEAEAAVCRGLCDHGPCGALFGDHHRVREIAENAFVERAQERHRLQVLAAAVDIGPPLAVSAAVIEIQHTGDGVYPEAVHVVFIEPEPRGAHQEADHLVLAVVEDAGAPILMLAFEIVGILVKARAVELVKPVRVLREMGGHPVQDHADTCLMHFIHEIHEIVRRAESGGNAEIPGDLIAPGTVERVLHHGHQLNVRVVHLGKIRGERIRQIAVGIGRAVVVQPPGARLHLVDVRGAFVYAAAGKPAVVFCVRPLKTGEVVHLAGVGRSGLAVESVGIRLHTRCAVRPRDAVFIRIVLPHAGNEPLPRAVRQTRHRQISRVPVVEGTGEAHRHRVRRPHAEHGAVVLHMRAVILVCAAVRPLMEQVLRDLVDILFCFTQRHTPPFNSLSNFHGEFNSIFDYFVRRLFVRFLQFLVIFNKEFPKKRRAGKCADLVRK